MHLDPTAFIADPELVDALQKRATPVTCDSDRVLFRQGDAPAGLYVLLNGEVTLSMTSWEGDSFISLQAAAGSLLGLPGLIGNEPYTLTAAARSGAQLSFINRGDFISLMQANPLLSLKILQVLAAEVRTARKALAAL